MGLVRECHQYITQNIGKAISILRARSVSAFAPSAKASLIRTALPENSIEPIQVRRMP
jgi:hypothetical protein